MDINYFDPKCGLIGVKKEPFLHPKCVYTITGRDYTSALPLG